ncbi:MAG: hypothetical protein KBC46_01680 [Ferrovibrio sp.]|jgi:exo-beta-1,3-glucanase (GH17 family)|nr:hypothetical protein [Ferrovibrio sp.]
MTAPARRFLYLLCFLALAALLNAAAWWYPNRPLPYGNTAVGQPIGQVKSVSFAPFKRGQSPLTKVYPTREEIAEDLNAVRAVARGVRTYTSREGLEAVPELAGRYGLEVTHSAWLGQLPNVNEEEVEALIDQANRYPDTIKRVIVGNEVLLRKDLTVDQLISYIRRVKAAVKQPVSYADVWEFWLRNPQLLDEVDFVTVHFLPYWEDVPIAVDHSMPHILDVYNIVQAKLPGKPILIGEVGWPSLGRSRREAVPTRHEAASFISDFIRLAEEKKLDYNLVEAFDQPWKVALEGTVGGAWGLLDELRHPKYDADGRLSELPNWSIYAALASLIGLILAVLQVSRLISLQPWRMLGAVLLIQVAGAALAACVEHGVSYNFSTLRFSEFLIMLGLQSIFALLLFSEVLDRLSGKEAPRAAFIGLGQRLRELKSFAPLYLPLGNHTVSEAKLAEYRRLYRVRLGEWLFAAFALYALYQNLMLAIAGRYRDFPIDYALLPIAGFLLLAVFGAASRGSSLATGFALPDKTAESPITLRCEAILAWLLLCSAVMVVLIERPSNREGLAWALISAAYALPLLGNLRLLARDGIARLAAAR